MFSWYKEGSQKERRTFWACFVGWAVDSFDMQMFAFLLPMLMALWHFGKPEAGVLGTAALLSSAVGGWIAGILADRYGRVRILQVTVIWFAFFSLVAGFASSYTQLLVIRTLQGIGFGGEWAVGAALMAEVIRPQHRGKAVGVVQAGYAIGWGLASIVVTALVANLPQDMAWRAAFWIGAIPAVLAILVRRLVDEPESFVKMQKHQHGENKEASLITVFRPRFIRTTVLTTMLAIGLQSSAYAVITWLPTILTQVRHLPSGQAVLTTLIMSIASFFGYVTAGYLSDHFGRRYTFIGFCVIAWITTVVYTLVPLGELALLCLAVPLGFAMLGVFALIGPFFSELFPTAVRTTGMGFAYNAGKSVGALSVAGVGVLSASMPLTQAVGLFCLFAYGLSIFATVLLPETRGRKLEEVTAIEPPAEKNTEQAAVQLHAGRVR